MKDVFEINWKLMGAKLAAVDSVKQGEFFTGFAKELVSYETHMAREMQMLEVNEYLDKKVKEVLNTYLQALWFNNTEDN